MGGGGGEKRLGYHIVEVDTSVGCYSRRKYLPEPKNPNSLKPLLLLASAVCREAKTLKEEKLSLLLLGRNSKISSLNKLSHFPLKRRVSKLGLMYQCFVGLLAITT